MMGTISSPTRTIPATTCIQQRSSRCRPKRRRKFSKLRVLGWLFWSLLLIAATTTTILPTALALNFKLHGINYSLRIGLDSDPTPCKTLENVVTDLAQLQTMANHLRVASVTDCDTATVLLEATTQVGSTMGLWLGVDAGPNGSLFDAERSTLLSLVQTRDFSKVLGIHLEPHASSLSIGEMIQFRNDIKADLVANGLSDLPVVVSYSLDDYLTTPPLTTLDDTAVQITEFPFFNQSITINHARAYLSDRLDAVLPTIGSRRVIFGATGWPDQGSDARTTNVGTGPSLQKWLRDFVCLALSNQWEYFWYTALDTTWETRQQPGSDNNPTTTNGVEGHYGIYNVDGTMKFYLENFTIDCSQPEEDIDPTATLAPQPTSSPTNVPTKTPTQSPTGVPTPTPSSPPSAIPSDSPTSVPSDTPTSVPSWSPSSLPSSLPSSWPSRLPSAVPSEEPSSQAPTVSPVAQPTTAAPTMASIATNATVLNLQMTLVGVTSTLDANAVGQFAATTEEWYRGIYAPAPPGRRQQRRRWLLFTLPEQEGARVLEIATAFTEFNTSILFQSQNTTLEGSNTITYHQQVLYRQPTTSPAVRPLDVLLSPFNNDVLRASLFAMLRASHPAFANVVEQDETAPLASRPDTTFASVIGDTQDSEDSSGGYSNLLLLGVAGGVAGALVAAVLLVVMHQRRRRKALLDDEDFRNRVAIDPDNDAVELLSDGSAPIIYTSDGTGKMVLDTEEMDTNPSDNDDEDDNGGKKKKKKKKKNRRKKEKKKQPRDLSHPNDLDNRSEASPLFKPRAVEIDRDMRSTSTNHDHGDIVCVSRSQLNDSLGDSPWARFGPEYADERNIFTVEAPPGKLGVVIDIPDYGPAIVFNVKRNSVLRRKLKVGDRLLALDGTDVTSYTANRISALIAQHSKALVRVFTLMRPRVHDYSDDSDSDEDLDEKHRDE